MESRKARNLLHASFVQTIGISTSENHAFCARNRSSISNHHLLIFWSENKYFAFEVKRSLQPHCVSWIFSSKTRLIIAFPNREIKVRYLLCFSTIILKSIYRDAITQSNFSFTSSIFCTSIIGVDPSASYKSTYSQTAFSTHFFRAYPFPEFFFSDKTLIFLKFLLIKFAVPSLLPSSTTIISCIIWFFVKKSFTSWSVFSILSSSLYAGITILIIFLIIFSWFSRYGRILFFANVQKWFPRKFQISTHHEVHIFAKITEKPKIEKNRYIQARLRASPMPEIIKNFIYCRKNFRELSWKVQILFQRKLWILATKKPIAVAKKIFIPNEWKSAYTIAISSIVPSVPTIQYRRKRNEIFFIQ